MTTKLHSTAFRSYVFEDFGDAAKIIKLRSDSIHAPLNPTQVRIKVYAAGVNPIDYKLVEQGPTFLPAHPSADNPFRIGRDFAGVIVEVGANVTELQVDDKVYGTADMGALGSFAEYLVQDEQFVTRKPKNMSLRVTAGLPGVGLSSYQAIMSHGNLKIGQRVLILGGSSGTGVVGIQIAKALGASFVAATTSSRNTAFVKSLGADQVIDYTSEKWWEVLGSHSIDLIYDCGFEALSWNDMAQQVLKPDTGIFVTLDPFAPLNESTTGTQKHQFVASPSRHDLEILTGLVEAGKLFVPIDSVHKFENLHAAITKQKSNRARGKIILEIIPEI